MKNNSKNQLRKHSLVRRVLIEIGNNLITGIRALATPKGIIAIIPIVVSVIAYLKTSYVVSNITMVLNEPIIINHNNVQDVEVLMTSDSKSTVYIQNFKFNIVKRSHGSYFDDCCNYIKKTNEKNSFTREVPFIISTEILDDSYKYKFNSGFIITPNSSILPMRLKFTYETDKNSEDRVSRATGAKFGGVLYNQKLVNILNGYSIPLSSGKSDISVCFSGNVYLPGSSVQHFSWKSDEKIRKLSTEYNIKKYDDIPQAPGRKQIHREEIRELYIKEGNFNGGVHLFTDRKINLFKW